MNTDFCSGAVLSASVFSVPSSNAGGSTSTSLSVQCPITYTSSKEIRVHLRPSAVYIPRRCQRRLEIKIESRIKIKKLSTLPVVVSLESCWLLNS